MARCFIFANLTKTFFLVHKLKTSHVIQSITLPHYLRNLKYQKDCAHSTSYPSSCYGYYIRKNLYARRVHNSFTESVSCETCRQTMNNFKLKTKYGSIYEAVFPENSCFRGSPAEVLQSIFIEFTLRNWCSPANLWHNFGTRFLQEWENASGVSNFKFIKRVAF